MMTKTIRIWALLPMRSNILLALLLGLLPLLGLTVYAANAAGSPTVPRNPLDSYNVVWTSPSKDAHGSMPLGNGDIGINAWVEPSGDLVFYISKTDAWDENDRLCKVGRVRVKFDPPLAVKDGFRQELKLREGVIEIAGKGVQMRLWVDANQPVVRLEAESAEAVNCQATVELWRLRERPFGRKDDCHSGSGLSTCSFKPTVLPDVVVASEKPPVVWYHRNTRSIYELCLVVQHLESLKNQFPDPLLNLTFGASMTGPGFVRSGAQAIKSAAPAKRHALAVTVLTEQTDTPDEWLAELSRVEKAAASVDLAEARRAHESWWRGFWDRSWIFVEGEPETRTVTRGYVLQRFMNACSGRGGSPIKFNGSIFTVEAKPGASPETPDGDPDWRQWGGCYWFQNTRLSFWPMLAAGDFDLMDAWFDMYQAALPLSKARVQTYYGFDNAAVFPETIYWWGLPSNTDYGWNNNAPEPANSHIRRYWNGSLELVAVMLDRYDFTQDERFAKERLVPLADPLINFLYQYWPKRDANGRIRFDPAQALESYPSAVNPMPLIAGLRFVLPRLLGLPLDVTTADQRGRWQKMLDEMPPLPVAEVDGVKGFQPGESFSGGVIRETWEIPELYAVFPYRLYGIGRPDLKLARDTYFKRKIIYNYGFPPGSIYAARLGLGEEATRMVAERAAQPSPSHPRFLAHRFPAMWGPNMDWTPDQTHGSNIMTTLQYMLLQSDGDKMYLLPAWPKNWDVSFKLHAPKNTTVQGVYRAGKLEQIKVTPESRRQDIVESPLQSR
jgi:hypothetical protein